MREKAWQDKIKRYLAE